MRRCPDPSDLNQFVWVTIIFSSFSKSENVAIHNRPPLEIHLSAIVYDQN